MNHDKTPERLAFEAAGQRLYEALFAERATLRARLLEIDREIRRISAGVGVMGREPDAGSMGYAEQKLRERPDGLTPSLLAEIAAEEGYEPITKAKIPRLAASKELKRVLEAGRGYRGAFGRYRLTKENL